MTTIKPTMLLSVNQLWFRFGVWLSKIFTPIIFLFIFFGLVTPAALAMRLFGRDELKMKVRQGSSHWYLKAQRRNDNYFEDQY